MVVTPRVVKNRPRHKVLKNRLSNQIIRGKDKCWRIAVIELTIHDKYFFSGETHRKISTRKFKSIREPEKEGKKSCPHSFHYGFFFYNRHSSTCGVHYHSLIHVSYSAYLTP